VKLLKNKISPGIYGISNIVIKGIKEESILQFISSRLFSIIMHLGHYPTQWSTAANVPVVKPNSPFYMQVATGPSLSNPVAQSYLRGTY